MTHDNLPYLPAENDQSANTCEAVRLSLAVWDDLDSEQQRHLTAHIHQCEACAAEARLLRAATQYVAALEGSQPSAHVDAAIHAFIAERAQSSSRSASSPKRPLKTVRQRKKGRTWQPAAMIAAVLMILAASLIIYIQVRPSPQEQFHLPANLTWNGYVLHYSQTRTTTQGDHYHVDTYYDLTNGMSHVQTTMEGQLDVVAVGNQQHGVLGKDMMHRVAQWDAYKWSENAPMFNLAQLRADLQSGKAAYKGKTTFQGQEVYQIAYTDNSILLLDMHYMPVNVLKLLSKDRTVSMYDELQVMPAEEVPQSLWDMRIPPGFTMGTLPQSP